jgi:phasin family protein
VAALGAICASWRKSVAAKHNAALHKIYNCSSSFYRVDQRCCDAANVLREDSRLKTKKPGTSTQRASSATNVAAKGSVTKISPAAEEPVVSATDVVDEATKPSKPSAQVHKAWGTEMTMREVVEKVIPAAPEPAVRVIDAISETITASPDPVAAATEEKVKPIAAIETTKPNSMLGTKTMIKSTEDFVAFGQANVEAFVKSGQIWTAGVQELTKLFAATTKASFDEAVGTLRAITSAKSVTEAINLQSAFASSVMAKTLADSNKLIDASMKLTEKTLAPITARVTGAVETFGKAA